MMADGNSKRVGSIEMPAVLIRDNHDAPQHFPYLFFPSISIAGYRLLDLPGRVFRDGNAFTHGGGDGYTLGAAEFQHALNVLAEKRCFDSELNRAVLPHQFLYF